MLSPAVAREEARKFGSSHTRNASQKSHDTDSHRNKALHASPRTTFSKARVFGDRATYKFKTKSLLISEI
jgi:hypothetical protein